MAIEDPGLSNVLGYAVPPASRRRNPFVHYLVILVGTVASFITFFAGLIVLIDESHSPPARLAGALAVAAVLGLVTFLIAQGYVQKIRAARLAGAAGPPLTRKQRFAMVIGGVIGWSLIVSIKFLPAAIRYWLAH